MLVVCKMQFTLLKIIYKSYFRSQLSNGSLLISSVLGNTGEGEEGSEQYQCVASVDSIGSILSRRATVSLARLSPLEQQPSSLRLFVGQTAHFACRVNGKPRPQVTWLKDQRPLVLDETRMLILPSGTGTSKLELIFELFIMFRPFINFQLLILFRFIGDR